MSRERKKPLSSPGRERRASEVDGIERVSRPDPVVRYVNLTLYNMVKDDETTLAISSTNPLPRLRASSSEYYEAPRFLSVVNRFKVMGGLNPVIYHEPTSSRFELRIAGEAYEVSCCFVDGEGEQTVTINIEKVISQPTDRPLSSEATPSASPDEVSS